MEIIYMLVFLGKIFSCGRHKNIDEAFIKNSENSFFLQGEGNSFHKHPLGEAIFLVQYIN